MKRIIIIFSLLLISLVLVNCSNNKKEIDYVVFSGTIENSIIDSLVLSDNNYKPIHTIHLDKNSSFHDTIPVSAGYYKLSDHQNSIDLFFKPSMNLKTTISYNENVPTLLFQNIGASENNYLQQKIQFDKNFEKVVDYKYFLKLDEEIFLKLADSINTEKVAFLNSQENLDKEFEMYESFTLKTEKSEFVSKYSKWKGWFIGDENFNVSENFPNPYANYNISDEKMIIHPKYLSSVFLVVLNKYDINYKFKEVNLEFLNSLDKEITIQKIKDELVYDYVKEGMAQTKSLDSVYTKYMSMVENEDYRKEIEEKYSRLKKIAKGIISPSFELYDIHNDLVTLESLRGKLVYIDVWATWCIPCVQEIPALKVLEEEFRNKEIYFVSMCLKDTKEQFERFVKEKELGGIQLFAPDENIPFIKEYLVRESGIPRFILVDKEGEIIDAHAYKPSDIRLKDLLLENL